MRRQVSLWLQPHANANPTEGEHYYDDASRNKTRSHKGGGTQNHTSVDIQKGQSSNAELQLDAVTNCYPEFQAQFE